MIPSHLTAQHPIHTLILSLFLSSPSGVFLYDTIPSDRSICGMVVAMLGVIAYTEENRRQQLNQANKLANLGNKDGTASTTTTTPEMKTNGSFVAIHENSKSNGTHDHKSNGSGGSSTHHPFSQFQDKDKMTSSSGAGVSGGGEPFVDIEKMPLMMVSDKDKNTDKSVEKKKWRDPETGGSNIDGAP